MKDSKKTEAKKANGTVGYNSNNREKAQMNHSSKKKDSDNDALEAISGYINKSDC